jgi:hypothetical protein
MHRCGVLSTAACTTAVPDLSGPHASHSVEATAVTATLCTAPLDFGSSQLKTLTSTPLVLPWTRHMPLKILLLPRQHQRHHHSGKSQHRISWTRMASCAMQRLAALCASQQQEAATGAAAAARYAVL